MKPIAYALAPAFSFLGRPALLTIALVPSASLSVTRLYPENGTIGQRLDTPLRMILSGRFALNWNGSARIRNLSNNAVVKTRSPTRNPGHPDQAMVLDSWPWKNTVGNAVRNVRPVVIDSVPESLAEIRVPQRLLRPRTRYQVEIDAGVLKGADGSDFAGVPAGAWTFTTRERPMHKGRVIPSGSPAARRRRSTSKATGTSSATSYSAAIRIPGSTTAAGPMCSPGKDPSWCSPAIRPVPTGTCSRAAPSRTDLRSTPGPAYVLAGWKPSVPPLASIPSQIPVGTRASVGFALPAAARVVQAGAALNLEISGPGQAFVREIRPDGKMKALLGRMTLCVERIKGTSKSPVWLEVAQPQSRPVIRVER